MGKNARCNVIYNIYNFYLKCVAFYNKNLHGIQKIKLTAQPMFLIFPEETLASRFKPKQFKFEFFVVTPEF